MIVFDQAEMASCTILVFYSQLDGIKAVSNKPKASSQALVIED